MRRIAFAALVVIAAVSTPARADDDDKPELQKMRFVERGDQLHVTASIAKLFDRAAYEALDSGFTSTVLIQIAIFPKDSNQAVVITPVTRQVLYNLWDEVYELRFDEPGGRSKIVKEKRKAEALRRITSLDDLAVSALAALPYDEIFVLGMSIELNPVDPKLMTEVRRWLSQGTGGGLDRGGAFFGTFVSVFVNPKIAAADRVIKIRSQPFYRPHP